MDGGYNAQVGEGGDMLSTGEKQLISFARAVLADPRLFVLDEATSSIDTVTEQLIQDATQKLMEGRTTFVVAHRLSTIRSADVILVVNGGKIIERGSHEELMAPEGTLLRPIHPPVRRGEYPRRLAGGVRGPKLEQNALKMQT